MPVEKSIRTFVDKLRTSHRGGEKANCNTITKDLGIQDSGKTRARDRIA